MTRLSVIFITDRPSEALPAMEIATLARLHPGHFVAGIRHGVPGWMEQIGALPDKPGRALERLRGASDACSPGSASGTMVDPDAYERRDTSRLARSLISRPTQEQRS